MIFTDGIMAHGEEMQGLQVLPHWWKLLLKENGFRINTDKTDDIICRDDKTGREHLPGRKRTIAEFKCLGLHDNLERSKLGPSK